MKFKIPAFILVVGAIGLIGCSSDDPATPGQDQSPEISQVVPATGESDAGLLQDFTFTFSQPMDPATLNDSTVTVTPAGGGLHLVYDAAGRKLWAAPDSLWAAGTTLRLDISDGATDQEGNPLVASGVEFSTGPLDCDHLADRFEPNDEISQASPIEEGSFPALSGCEDDKDFFSVTLADTAMVTAHNTFTYADSASWGIHWLRQDGLAYSTLGGEAFTGQGMSFHFTFLPGTYYLQVFGTGLGDYVLYDLDLEMGDPCQDDPYEDNDFEDEAAPITAGHYEELRGCFVDSDWFSVPVTAGQTIAMAVDSETYTGFQHRRLRIKEPGGGGVVSNSSENPVSLELIATQTGTALVMVQFWEDGVVYSLDVTTE